MLDDVNRNNLRRISKHPGTLERLTVVYNA